MADSGVIIDTSMRGGKCLCGSASPKKTSFGPISSIDGNGEARDENSLTPLMPSRESHTLILIISPFLTQCPRT